MANIIQNLNINITPTIPSSLILQGKLCILNIKQNTF